MKQILLATLCALAVLTSCKESKNNQVGAITFNRADISGAKFLTLTGGSDNKASTETNTVYKIDENGNMTVVAFYLEIDQDGNKSIENVSGDIKVVPSRIIDYGKEYMLFSYCELIPITDKYRNFISRFWWAKRAHLLVRKSDGAIFEIDTDQLRYFPSLHLEEDFIQSNTLTYNSRGDLYMIGDKNVSKLKVENEKLLLQQITTGIYANGIMVDKNDNLYVGDRDFPVHNNLFFTGGYMYLANGSVSTTIKGGQLLLIDNEYYIIEQTRDETLTYVDFKLCKVNSFLPNINLKEVATVTYEKSWPNYITVAIDKESKVIFIGDRCFIFDKLTQQLSTAPLSDGFDKVSFNQQGIAYEYSEQNCTQITRYDIVDMTKKTIECDRSAVPPFIQTKTKVTSIDFFEFGIQNSNGAPIRVQTNLETGKVTVHEDADDRAITELIRVS